MYISPSKELYYVYMKIELEWDRTAHFLYITHTSKIILQTNIPYVQAYVLGYIIYAYYILP